MAVPLSFIAYTALISRSETPVAQQLLRSRDSGSLTNDAYNECMAIALPERPQGSLLWLHAGTKRAFHSTVELFRRLQDERPDLNGLLTANFDPNTSHYQPVEGLWITRLPEERTSIIHRFLSHWDPDCLIWVGGNFRPALLHLAHMRGLPTLSIDAPDSPPVLDAVKNIPGLRAATMRVFDHVITGSTANNVPWRRAGLDRNCIEAHGFLEEGSSLPHFNEAELNALSDEVETRPVWFATNVNASEFEAVLCAHKVALRRAHRLLLIISVKDTKTADALKQKCLAQGLNTIMRAESTPISEAVQILIADDSEEDGLWYRLSPVTFLGQSLTEHGGTDPYAAATFGSAMLHGPHVARFTNAYERFHTAKATRIVQDGNDLGVNVIIALAADCAAAMAHAAWEVSSAGAEVTDRVTNLVHDILDLREEMAP